ncbi:MAG: class I SAM-dependent methyltransferase [Acidimicrobiales bacterium]
MAVTPVAAAYSATGGAWERGPARIYDRLAEVLIGRSPVPLAGRRVLDVGAGTGAASRAVLAAGAAEAVAVDAALGMLAHQAADRPAAVAGDALALPFATSVFDAAVAAFSLNHVATPAAGLREMARVTRPGGAILAATYAADDVHPAKEAVRAALAAHGWAPDPWYMSLGVNVLPLLATPERCADAAQAAELDATVEAVHVPFPDLDARDLVAWRLGMAQHAPFAAGLSGAEREAVVIDAVGRLGDAPPLVRSVLVLSAIRS